jgi:hypothetical protein
MLRAADLFVYVWMAPGMARDRAHVVPAGKECNRATSPVQGRTAGRRAETTVTVSTGRAQRARHGVHTFWGMITCGAATVTANTVLGICLATR